MATADEDTRAFVISHGAIQDEALDVAIVFARSMFDELNRAAADWQLQVAALEERLAERELERAARRRSLFGSASGGDGL